MNWNIYFQAFTVRTWRKRLSNLNTFLTPHIYWGIHITICVNYNQHTGEVIRALSMRDAGKRMTIFPSPSRSASFFPSRVSLSFIPAQPMFIRRRLKRRRWPIRRMPTFFISFHRNSSEEPNQYTGVETLVYDNSGIKQTMAENINGALSELGFRNLGVKARPGLVVLRRTKMPALLIETGFLNNEQDNTLYDEKQEEIARAIADAVLGTLDLETVTEADRRAAETEAARPSVSTADTVTASASPRPTPPEQENPSDTPETFYRVQTGLFRIRQNADRMLYDLLDQGYPAFLLAEDGFFKVQVGAYRQLGNAILMERRLRRDGYSTLITT